MEKVPNKYVGIIRTICYILIPICILAIIQSVISLCFFAEQEQNTKSISYYETKQFTDLYNTSIYNNVEACYYYVQDKGYEVYTNNLYEVTQSNTENGDIYYRTYLENKNFKFLIVDNKTNKAFTNLEQTMRTDTIEEIKEELSSYTYYWNYEDNQVNTNIKGLSLEDIKYKYHYKSIEENYDCKIYTAMQTPIKYYDDYYNLKIIHNIVRKTSENAIINIIISFILILISIILITIFAGKKKGEKEIYLDIIDKVPLEIVIGFISIISLVAFILFTELSYNANIIVFVAMFFIGSILYLIALTTYETIIKRIKSHTLFTNTIIYRIIKFIIKTVKDIYTNINLTLKIGVTISAFAIITSILANCKIVGIIILLFIYVIIFKICFKYAKQVLKIKETAKQIYEGNTEIRIKEDEYKGILRELCAYINNIANGLTNAVEKGIKSERMKTELITNVSHDIKTPLTSIINYVDLLKKEEMPNEKAKEYLEILDKKSQRLKRLIEDLVEASKASSGNIKLNLEKLDIKELIKQVSGEFEDKLKNKKLELILTIPEEETNIIADSRYLYRIIENIYSNIVKYALPDSRVYVDIIVDDEKVKIELKNISKDKLNISADELMERFVRGEASRNTEGSGLRIINSTKLNRVAKWNI